jgi:hypothetical protein
MPASVYFAAYTTAPDDSGGGVECTGGSYARVEFLNDDTLWSAPTGSPTAVDNNVVITWPTATESWGDVVAVGVFDSSTDGNLLAWSTTPAKTVSAGDTLRINPGFLSISLD